MYSMTRDEIKQLIEIYRDEIRDHELDLQHEMRQVREYAQSQIDHTTKLLNRLENMLQ